MANTFNKPWLRAALLTGLLAGLTCFLYVLVLWLLGVQPFGRFKYLYVGIYALFFVGGLWYYRMKLNRGELSSVRALAFGIALNLLATLVYGLLVFTLLASTGNRVLEQHTAALAKLQQDNIGYLQAQIAQALELKDLEAADNLQEQLDSMQGTYAEFQKTDITAGLLAMDQAMGLFMTGFFLTFLFMLLFRSRSENSTPLKKPPHKK